MIFENIPNNKSPIYFMKYLYCLQKYMEGKIDEVTISNHIHDMFVGVTEDSVHLGLKCGMYTSIRNT